MDILCFFTGKKPYLVIAVSVGLLYVLQVVLNISLRLSLIELMTLIVSTDHYLKQNWIHFSGSFYYISTTEKSWQSSRDDCLGRGADLITIDSREENFEKRLWIGLSDRQSEGNWIWQDGSPLRKSFWQPEEPNSYSGTDEDCVEIGNFDDDNSWNDLVCTEAIFWICEKKTGA
uniref:C-type lectin domain-containing protein n=1 Tax=Oryzias melastigma TaxID=30732 RepID=A0A3B3DEI6_ORYME